MNLFASILFFLPTVSFKRAAKSKLIHLAASMDVQQLWDEMLRQQHALATQRPRYAFGTNLLLRYMEWDCALYRAARQHGMPMAEAKQLIEEINWQAFGPMIETSFVVSRLRSSQQLKRVKWVLDMMFSIIFTAPFRRTVLPLTDAIAFDVIVCPLARYFTDRGVPELTSAAACSLDYRMADVWGAILLRKQTIAAGAPHCDFRFEIKLVDSHNRSL